MRANNKKSARLLPSSTGGALGAKLALQNARRHLRAAEALAKKKLFGSASTHVVLSVEELVKAWVLALHSMGFEFPLKMLNAVLFEHSARHMVTFGVVFVLTIRYLAVRTTRRVQKRHGIKDYPAKLRDEWVAELMRDLQSLASRSPRNEPVLAVWEWIGNANKIKNNGLYVDFNGNKWSHPGQVKARQYSLGHDIADRLIRQFGREIRASLRMGFQANDQLNALLNEQFKKAQGRSPEEIFTELTKMALRPLAT